MTAKPTRQIYINVAVRDPHRSKEFFSKLGFEFNPKFTDEKAACMIISEQAFVMLLGEPFFKTFTRRGLCNTTKETEGIFAFSCVSRAEVDDLVKKAVAAGGKHAMDPQDHGFMYSWSFYDLDDHHWEVLWMDPKAAA
jgi:predicted lactoylglutathione lyase